MKWLAIFLALTLTSSSFAEDPLKNSKKLISKGHSSLYENGAIKIPYTTMTFIPAGPAPLELAQELVGLRARQSLLLSLKNAKESINIVSKGSTASFKLAQKVSDIGTSAATYIHKNAKKGSTLLIYRSSNLGKEMIGKSYELSKETANDMSLFAKALRDSSYATAKKLDRNLSFHSAKSFKSSIKKSKRLSKKSENQAANNFKQGYKLFIEGYVTLGDSIGKRFNKVVTSKTLDQFVDDFESISKFREEKSDKVSYIISDTINEYTNGIGISFGKAKKEMQGAQNFGYTFATVKALRWVLQGILWDAMIKPVGKISSAALGFAAINGIAYPIILGSKEGLNTIELAVEVIYQTGGIGYDIIAPTAGATLAAIFGTVGYLGGKTAAGGTVAGGTLYSGGVTVAKHIGKVGAIAGGELGYATVKYIGVPLASAGVLIGGSSFGVAMGASGITTGVATRAAGEIVSGTTAIFGNILASGTAVAGISLSTVGGIGLGVYELSKAVVVPTGYTLGSGVVLGYGTLSHLAAHSVLAATDTAYVVLSLEGPRWVIYAVSGKLGKGEYLPVGAVLNLGKMQKKGEQFHNIPITNEEMSDVVKSLSK